MVSSKVAANLRLTGGSIIIGRRIVPVAVKPGEWEERASLPLGLPPIEELLRCPISGEVLRAETSEVPGVEVWLVTASRSRAFPVRGGQRMLKVSDAVPAPG